MEKTYAQLIREGWLSFKEAQAELNYSSHSTLLGYCQRGKVEALKVEGKWVISPKGIKQAQEIKPNRRAEVRK